MRRIEILLEKLEQGLRVLRKDFCVFEMYKMAFCLFEGEVSVFFSLKGSVKEDLVEGVI